jgi:hypothetical protein
VTFCYGFLLIFFCEAEPPPPAVTVCPPVSAWTLDYQEQLAQEFAKLPKGTAMGTALREHLRLREQLRKCQK